MLHVASTLSQSISYFSNCSEWVTVINFVELQGLPLYMVQSYA